MNLGRFAIVRWALYLVALLLQLARDISVSCGVWWAMVQQREAGWKRRRALQWLAR